MYNLLSDKLDRFEREVRKFRNSVVAKIMCGLFKLGHFSFSHLKPYIHIDYLRSLREQLKHIDCKI